MNEPAAAPPRAGDAGASGSGGAPGRGNQVNSLRHGLSILCMYDEDHPVAAVSDMARHLGLHRSSASRLAATLRAMGFLARAGEAGQYRLGPRLVRLGRLAGQNNDLVRQALAPLGDLVAATGETGHIGVLDGTEVLTVGVVDGWHTVRMHGQVDKRSPAYCSSLGKALLSGRTDASIRELFRGRRLPARTANSITTVTALLAELARVRATGFAVDDEELEPGLRCVAAPIVDAGGAVVASLGLSGPAARLTAPVLADLAERVRATAARASAAIGGPDPAG